MLILDPCLSHFDQSIYSLATRKPMANSIKVTHRMMSARSHGMLFLFTFQILTYAEHVGYGVSSLLAQFIGGRKLHTARSHAAACP